MLRALGLKDFVIVERLDLEFASGFTALTGETGAGKSILVDALGLVLGARAETGMVRPGAERAEIAAEFETLAREDVGAWLAANDIGDEGGACLVRRTVDRSGRSRAFVNGSPVTAGQLRELGERLVDIHGQGEHQWLLQRDYQRRLLDTFAGAEDAARKVAALHALWRQAREQREMREQAQEGSAREREFLRDEIRDLEALAFAPQAWSEEEAEHRRLAHAQELIVHARSALEALDEAEPAAAGLLSRALAHLEEGAQVDPLLADAQRDAQAAVAHAGEATHQLRRYLQRIEADPVRLDALDRRLRAVHDACRRFRVDPAGLPEALESRRQRLEALGGDESLDVLRKRESDAERAWREAGRTLSGLRREGGARLAEEVTRRLQGLAMEGGRLAVVLEPLAAPGASGLEGVEFQVAAHAGQPLGPVAKVASGGELSRLALAIQVLMGGRAAIPTLVFDEVDAGIGGRVAEVVGSLLAELARHHQVLCVTHLAQVASCARHQLRVSKHAQAGETVAAVEALDATGRVEEIARMLGGKRITETTRRHATEMLEHAAAAGRQRRRTAGAAR
jgi:DNA repair protein RecN (Recombination protein N)